MLLALRALFDWEKFLTACCFIYSHEASFDSRVLFLFGAAVTTRTAAARRRHCSARETNRYNKHWGTLSVKTEIGREREREGIELRDSGLIQIYIYIVVQTNWECFILQHSRLPQSNACVCRGPSFRALNRKTAQSHTLHSAVKYCRPRLWTKIIPFRKYF